MNKHPMAALGELDAIRCLLDHVRENLKTAKTQFERDFWAKAIKKLEQDLPSA